MFFAFLGALGVLGDYILTAKSVLEMSSIQLPTIAT